MPARKLWFETVRPLVLVADDDPDILFALGSFLDAIGYDVVSCPGGAEMLDALASTADTYAREADVIITDIRMPGLNGISIAEELRADGWPQPIVVISAFDDDMIREHVSRIERCAFFSKPLDPAALEQTLVRLRSRSWRSGRLLHFK